MMKSWWSLEVCCTDWCANNIYLWAVTTNQQFFHSPRTIVLLTNIVLLENISANMGQKNVLRSWQLVSNNWEILAGDSRKWIFAVPVGKASLLCKQQLFSSPSLWPIFRAQALSLWPFFRAQVFDHAAQDQGGRGQQGAGGHPTRYPHQIAGSFLRSDKWTPRCGPRSRTRAKGRVQGRQVQANPFGCPVHREGGTGHQREDASPRRKSNRESLAGLLKMDLLKMDLLKMGGHFEHTWKKYSKEVNN